MGLFSKLLIKRFTPPVSVINLGETLTALKLKIDFVIEAGAHEGSDTLLLSNLNGVKKVYCFEPNPFSFNILQSKISRQSEKNIEISNLGLFDKNMKANLFFPKIDLGGFQEKQAGTSSLLKNWAKSDGEFIEVELVSLDNFLKSDLDFKSTFFNLSGLLWLDVEGSALLALKGMERTLSRVNVAKIELEYGIQKGQWDERNLFKIIKFMKQRGFSPYAGYLHPLTRGDLLFIRSNKLGIKDKLKTFTYCSLLHLFYGFIYPLKARIEGH
jgi:FkbM family methyltransferase